jgi:HSP20 family protein
MQSDDVDLQIENNILTIRGEKQEERKEEDENRRFHVWERSYGSFQRSFTLPRTVKADEITAEFEDGLLRVSMPKSPEARGRRIQVGGGRRQVGGSEQMGRGEQLGSGETKKK